MDASYGKRRLDWKWLQAWMVARLPRQRTLEDARGVITALYPKQKLEKWKYAKCSFWRERLLARFRMGVLPSRSWACSMKLAETALCRHCHEDEETMDHLLLYCDEVDRDNLVEVWYRVLDFQEDITLKAVSKVLKHDFRRRMLEEALIHFIRINNLSRNGEEFQKNTL